MQLQLSAQDLLPIVQQVVAEVLNSLDSAEARLPAGRLAFRESEAAAMLGLRPHNLRDARQRGELTASLCGKKLLYARQDLVKWLQDRRVA